MDHLKAQMLDELLSEKTKLKTLQDNFARGEFKNRTEGEARHQIFLSEMHIAYIENKLGIQKSPPPPIQENQETLHFVSTAMTDLKKEIEEIKSCLRQDTGHKFEELIEKQQKLLEEKENELKFAKQHLAKKVREHLISLQRIEELSLRLNEMQNHVLSWKEKWSMAEKVQEDLTKKEKILQDTLSEKLHQFERDARRKEEKIAKLQEELLSYSKKVKEMEDVEKKYQQLKALVS